MTIIETLKQGNNEYNFNKEFLNIDSSGYSFLTSHKTFDSWFKKPLYISSSYSNNKSTYDFKEPHYGVITLSNSDKELKISGETVYCFIDNEADVGYLCFTESTLLTTVYHSGSSYKSSSSKTLDNFYSGQLVTDINFANNNDIKTSLKKGIVIQRQVKIQNNSTPIRSIYKYCYSPSPHDPVTHEEVIQNGESYQTVTVTDGYQYEYRTYQETGYNINNLIDSSFTSPTAIIYANQINRFGNQILIPSYTNEDFNQSENISNVSSFTDYIYLHFVIGIKVLNWSLKYNEFNSTIYEYLKNEIINNGQQGKITLINSNYQYTEEEFQNNSDVITTEIGKYYQIYPNPYVSNYDIYYRNENDLIKVANKNDYIFFTQSEIDEIFNPTS